jgi:hypothetical protein
MRGAISRKQAAEKVIENMQVGKPEMLGDLARKARHNHGYLRNREMGEYLKHHTNLRHWYAGRVSWWMKIRK